MNVKLCSHIKIDGLKCRAVASSGRTLCLAHQRLLQRSRRCLRLAKPRAFRLGPLTSYGAIQSALSRVLSGFAACTLPQQAAEACIRRCQLATQALIAVDFPREVPVQAPLDPVEICHRRIQSIQDILAGNQPPDELPAEFLAFDLPLARLYNQPNLSRESPPQPPARKQK